MDQSSDSRAGSSQATFCLTLNDALNTLDWWAQQRRALLGAAFKLANTLTGGVLDRDQRHALALVQENLLDLAVAVIEPGEAPAVRLEVAFFGQGMIRGDDERSYFKISVSGRAGCGVSKRLSG